MSFPCRARDTLTWGWFRHHRARLAGGWLLGVSSGGQDGEGVHAPCVPLGADVGQGGLCA